MKVKEAMGMKTAFFPHTAETQTGAAMQGQYEPTDKGTKSTNGGEDLQPALERVAKSRKLFFLKQV